MEVMPVCILLMTQISNIDRPIEMTGRLRVFRDNTWNFRRQIEDTSCYDVWHTDARFPSVRLAILLKAVENERTTVDLRNEASIFGTVEQADAYMNIVMRDCVFTDPRGDSYDYDVFFVQARNIRYVHIPPKIRIIPAIQAQLRQLSRGPKCRSNTRRTLKIKRAQEKQEEGLAAVHEILRNRTKDEHSEDN
ncbi:hypothetical protein KM043_000742 [Ampulex compressa]|nr:hypothetical protein KM043_000742 [Ampulex compressa]